MRTLEGKVALVLGGTCGIGAAISRRIAADGAPVAVVYLSRSIDADSFASELREQGTVVCVVQADISDPRALDAAIDKVVLHPAGGPNAGANRSPLAISRHGRNPIACTWFASSSYQPLAVPL